MTQRARILRALRNGPVLATDFAAPNVIDGGLPVFRVAARVGELRDQGYDIRTSRSASGVAVYTLTSEAVEQDSRRSPEGKPPVGASPTDPAVLLGAVHAEPDVAPSDGSDVTRSPADPLLSSAGDPLFNTDELAPRRHIAKSHYTEDAA